MPAACITNSANYKSKAILSTPFYIPAGATMPTLFPGGIGEAGWWSSTLPVIASEGTAFVKESALECSEVISRSGNGSCRVSRANARSMVPPGGKSPGQSEASAKQVGGDLHPPSLRAKARHLWKNPLSKAAKQSRGAGT